MNASEFINKPKLRGVIHGCAFACTMLSTIVFAVSSFLYKFDSSIALYQLSQLLQYGISSLYHIPSWAPRTKRIMRHLDHMCIFVLISGTQTSVLINITDIGKNHLAKHIIRVSWAISAVGILKIILMNKLHNMFDLVVYMAHGMVVAPFYRLLAEVALADKALVGIGAFLYIVGGVVYGLERPNPFPRLFGYHEVFHALTIAANLCFATIITRKYFYAFLTLFLSPVERVLGEEGKRELL
ncbi:hemolysin III [Pancytospora epiphaga]|nr:hemolysin III [Pancytospora epiphaga]